MKPAPTCSEWRAISEHLENATREIAEVANILERRVQTEQVCDETKRIETDLCVLESKLRHLRRQSERACSAVFA
jgi:ubiquinone biosynthesis protein UbiJ